MAFFIYIDKISETVDEVVYEYSDVQARKGRLRLDKATGDVIEVVAAPGDDQRRRFQRATIKVLQHWRNGEFPDKTCWAS